MSTTVDTITADALRDALDRGEPLTVLDVRPAAERAEWAIPGSVHVDAYEQLKAGNRRALDAFDAPEGVPVVTVCAAGRTSLIAAELLSERGLDARSLDGGMKGWSMAWNTATVVVPGSSATVVQVRRTGKGCLSYLIGSGNEAAVIDPALDPAVYQQLAHAAGWTITAVLDTHIHADHLSRARLLAEAAGATLFLPAQDRARFPFQPLRDGDTLPIGDARVRALHTPGHTGESMCYLLDECVVFTGDTLFLASVGRPDLEASAGEARWRARALYHSLQRLIALPADTRVLPGHASEPIPFSGEPLVTTVARAHAVVPLLDQDEATFVETILGRIPPTPPNHHAIVEANEAGELPPGDLTDLEAGANRCAVML